MAGSGPSPAQDRCAAVFRGLLRSPGVAGFGFLAGTAGFTIFRPVAQGLTGRGSGPEATLPCLVVITACLYAGAPAYRHADLPDRAFIAGFDIGVSLTLDRRQPELHWRTGPGLGAGDHPEKPWTSSSSTGFCAICPVGSDATTTGKSCGSMPEGGIFRRLYVVPKA